MLAVILIGGLGTRLRPLTCDTPKPLLPILNKPFLHYQFQALKAHGVREIVLCTSYRASDFRRAFGTGRSLGLKLSFVHEREPLGTGGALKNAESLVAGKGPVLAMNGDVLNGLDLSAFLRFHRARRGDLSIALTRVKDPTQYGLVKADPDGRIREFLEKPSSDEIESNTINAGTYVFDPSVLRLIPPGTPYSLERNLFPQLASQGRVFGYVMSGYWIDIGTIGKYLQAHHDILSGRAPFKPRGLREAAPGPDAGRAVLGPGTVVGKGVRFAGHVCVGPRCRIGRGAWLEDCVVLAGTSLGPGARLERCVVGPSCRVGEQAALGPGAVLGGGSVIKAYSQL